MIRSRKAQDNTILTILITIVPILSLVIWAVLLTNTNDIEIDNSKIRTQLIVNQIFSKQCFSDTYGTIEKEKINQKNLDDCLHGLDEKNLVKLYFPENQILYYDGKKDMHEDRRRFCFSNSNFYCTQMIYPVTFTDTKNGIYSTDSLIVEIIVS